MRGEDLLYWIRTAPFRPFRIHLVTGRAYDIRHPEMLKVDKTHAIVFSYRGESVEQIEQIEMIGVMLIERSEPLEAGAAA